jgi:hypothetical protein
MSMLKGRSAFPITKGILKLARQIDATSAPDYVSVEPGEGCLPGRSFQNVVAIVRMQGGSVQHGWRLREQPAAYVEGEFIAVWRRPDGVLIDVTPRTDGLNEIIFLPDSKMVWDGEDVESRRMMLHEQPCYCGSGMPYKICHGLADE